MLIVVARRVQLLPYLLDLLLQLLAIDLNAIGFLILLVAQLLDQVTQSRTIRLFRAAFIGRSSSF